MSNSESAEETHVHWVAASSGRVLNEINECMREVLATTPLQPKSGDGLAILLFALGRVVFRYRGVHTNAASAWGVLVATGRALFEAGWEMEEYDAAQPSPPPLDRLGRR